MKKLLWTSAMALTAVACLTACDDSSSGASNSIPTYKTEAALPDTCEMEVAKVDTAYFACFENKWVEVTDSATVEKIKEGLDEEDLKEELEDMMAKLSSSSKKPSSSSKKVESSDDEGDVEIESSSSEEACTGRRCKTGGSSSSKKSSGGNGGSGSEEPTSTESSSPSSAESSSPSSAESSSPSSVSSSTGSSPSSVSSSTGSSPSSSATSSSSSACNTSLKRDANFCVLDDFVEWDEDGITATITANITGTALMNMIKDAGFTNTVISSSSSMITNNELLETLGSDWRVESNNLLSMMNVQTVKDSSVYVIIVTYPKKGEHIYTDVIPMGKCGTKAYSKRTQFCDTRGTGTLYKHVTIGEQTWMAENLNYPTSSGSYCYSGLSSNCEKYGRLYTWDVAVDNACPTGWHLPTHDEILELFDEVGSAEPLHVSGTSGFDLLLAGKYTSSTFSLLDSWTCLWTATEATTSTSAHCPGFNSGNTLYPKETQAKTGAFSVRCVKD